MNGGDDAPAGSGLRLRSPAVLAVLLALVAAAVAARLALGAAPPGRHSGTGAAAPASRLCFCGPGGEVLDFPAGEKRRLHLAAAP